MFIAAFLCGGILCALFQIFAMFTELEPPRVLILGIAMGALLTPYGMMGALTEWGGGGIAMMVIGAGNAIADAVTALLGGVAAPAITLILVLAIIVFTGIAAGYIRSVNTNSH